MKKLHVKATFIEPVLGTWPANPNVAREFIASKSPDAATIEDEVAAERKKEGCGNEAEHGNCRVLPDHA